MWRLLTALICGSLIVGCSSRPEEPTKVKRSFFEKKDNLKAPPQPKP